MHQKGRSRRQDVLQICRAWIYDIGRIAIPDLLYSDTNSSAQVAYIDPGNYATDVAAGASSRYSLLFVVLVSNLFAVFLQSLCIKLGSVTGLNLAEMCRTHLPRCLTVILYIFSEAAIIATDIAEVGSG